MTSRNEHSSVRSRSESSGSSRGFAGGNAIKSRIISPISLRHCFFCYSGRCGLASDPVGIAIHCAILLVLPPFFLGLIAKTKAFVAGRKGAPLLQPYFDLGKLVRKGMVYSDVASWIVRIAPVIILVAIVSAGLFLPLFGKAPIHFEGDIILFAYLLAVGRFWTLLAAWDVGSSFEGMGASREATFGALSELAFFLSLIVLVLTSHSTSLTEVFYWKLTHFGWQPVFLLLFVTLFLTLLAENSRMPVDDPTTHLELTMIHEVMILDYSGVDLGCILYGAGVKLFLFMALAVSLLWPPAAVWSGSAVALFFCKMCGMAVLIGIVESVTARVRLVKVPQLLIANFVIALFALLVAVSGRGI
ncbi:MAG: NADH-quinone oxidoreductase subunit H [Deltaproteobacteria bacterium]|nr:NADH-quinone oxidoreductase subunit H [Deltaproteobacteria bacterium]